MLRDVRGKYCYGFNNNIPFTIVYLVWKIYSPCLKYLISFEFLKQVSVFSRNYSCIQVIHGNWSH
jgi:hypothetical protein